MATTVKSLWDLALSSDHVDPAELAHAVEAQLDALELDHRTRWLIRDSVSALRESWSESRMRQWIDALHKRDVLKRIEGEEFGAGGFASLKQRVMETTSPDKIEQFLRELGTRISEHARVAVGGSVSLILSAGLSRRTDDIDVVDELPPGIRTQHELLDNLAARYGLRLAHFQSHYLPDGWSGRTRSLGVFGRLEVHLVDPHDVALSKLMSAREKDRDDLRVIVPLLEKGRLVEMLGRDCARLLGEAELLKNARENWYVLFGEQLPRAGSP